jgi:hypothetical protein
MADTMADMHAQMQ